MRLSPLYVVPLLVEQPTWGGSYIAGFKGITNPEVTSKNIGQVYELAEDSVFTTQPTADIPYLVGNASNLNQAEWYGSQLETITMQDLIDRDPKGVLGTKVLAKSGRKMTTLIKFTQARNNSYQLHVRPGHEFGKWVAKPESWYYLEPGRATLGLKAGTSVEAYRRCCEAIYAKSQELSQAVKSNTLSLVAAKQELQNFIDLDHPRNYVNPIAIDKSQVVDLSSCGIHHSWETDASLPEGNIVYEVQVDVRDEVSSIRSYDQGNMKDDGGVRELAIADYFQALVTDPAANHPEQYMQASAVTKDSNTTITTIFDNEHYQLKKIDLQGTYGGPVTTTTDSFHHLFVNEGEVQVSWQGQTFPLAKGWSLFIPAACGEYSLHSDDQSEVLLTSA